jgi:demethylmenaquinone methyltransferase/2-methoxy-6-polyprenyl-1,4-benzoquinol methylase
MSETPTALLQWQIAYYQARASEYDEWFLRQGRYDRGPTQNAQWFTEVDEVRQQLVRFNPTGEVLELACGTGWWTGQLLQYAHHLTAVDAAAEVLAINRTRYGHHPIDYVQADLFTWRPTRSYDAVFFSFWLSHVPPERFAAFWRSIAEALQPGGRVFFLDSLASDSSTARDQAWSPEPTILQSRRLNDGREFEIVKIYYRPEALSAQLRALGWHVTVSTTSHYFLHGTARYKGLS